MAAAIGLVGAPGCAAILVRPRRVEAGNADWASRPRVVRGEPMKSVTGAINPFEHGLNMADVEIRLGDSQPDFWSCRLGPAHDAIRLKEDGRRNLPVQPRPLDGIDGFIVPRRLSRSLSRTRWGPRSSRLEGDQDKDSAAASPSAGQIDVRIKANRSTFSLATAGGFRDNFNHSTFRDLLHFRRGSAHFVEIY